MHLELEDVKYVGKYLNSKVGLYVKLQESSGENSVGITISIKEMENMVTDIYRYLTMDTDKNYVFSFFGKGNK